MSKFVFVLPFLVDIVITKKKKKRMIKDIVIVLLIMLLVGFTDTDNSLTSVYTDGDYSYSYALTYENGIISIEKGNEEGRDALMNSLFSSVTLRSFIKVYGYNENKRSRSYRTGRCFAFQRLRQGYILSRQCALWLAV